MLPELSCLCSDAPRVAVALRTLLHAKRRNSPIRISELQNQSWGPGSLSGTVQTSLLVELLPPAAVPLLSRAAGPCPCTSARSLVLESPPAL